MSALALLHSTETAISSTQHKYKHISFNKILAGALTPSNLIQNNAGCNPAGCYGIVASAVEGAGRICAAGETG